MEVIRVDLEQPDPVVLRRAAEVLRGGGLVAFPTETVYGLGANALDEAAVRRIFAAKGRPAYNPLIAHAPDAETVRSLVSSWPETARVLAAEFWPGPLTLVLPKRGHVPDVVSAGLPTVAVRVPAHPVALALLRAAAVPLAAPSANPFTAVSPTTARHVEKGLGSRVDLILDGGPTRVGIESTVLDLSGEVPVLLRPGVLSVREIEGVVGPVALREEMTGAAPRPSPGMVERHYSPRAELRIFPAERRAEMTRTAEEAEGRLGVLLLDGRSFPAPHVVRMPADPGGYARALYAALHDLDDAGCDLILVDGVPPDPEWAGVRDRLRRAAVEVRSS